ncbi:MAG TPA: hypothetical protein VGQ78_03825 [Vicinamibacteria bacterium]|jgi:hypothetical protein|nr:hypothetical protein [Vicinamibacteria bacterium]
MREAAVRCAASSGRLVGDLHQEIAADGEGLLVEFEPRAVVRLVEAALGIGRADEREAPGSPLEVDGPCPRRPSIAPTVTTAG